METGQPTRNGWSNILIVIGKVTEQHFEGLRPEWYISTIYHCRDIPFWLETLQDLLTQDSPKWLLQTKGAERPGHRHITSQGRIY